MYWFGTLNATASFLQMSEPRLIQGIGLAFFFMPLQQVMLSDVDAAHLASAAGLSNFMRNIAGSMATAACIWIWSARSDFHHVMLTQHIATGNNWADWSQQLNAVGADSTAALMQTENVVMQQAQTMGANDLFLIFTALLVLCMPVIWLSRPPFRLIGSAGAH